MAITRCTELNRRLARLFCRLFDSRLGQTGSSNNLGKLDLILRCMEATIKGCHFDRSMQTVLHNSCLFHYYVAVVFVPLEKIPMCDESDRILVYQDQSPELHGLTGLATFVQLSVGFKNTEKLSALGTVSPCSTRRARCCVGSPYARETRVVVPPRRQSLCPRTLPLRRAVDVHGL